MATAVSNFVIEVTDQSFATEVIERSKTTPVVVDFWADWCGPCKRLAPQVEKLATQKKDVQFYKVNVDDNAEVAAEQKINAMPTIVFFKAGERVHEVVGANFAKIVEGVTEHM